jgi:hypothetical protein
MCSRWARYVFKAYLCSSIHFHVGDLLNFPIALPSREQAEAIESLEAAIIEKQKADPRYPYHLYEQREIDRLVYDLYGLNEEDIAEVEAWYRRRYPKLAVFEEDDSGFLQELREATAFAADLTDEQWEILLHGKPRRRRRKAVEA